MIEYLKKYPSQHQDIHALMFAFGSVKTDSICKDALGSKKQIKLITDINRIDFLDYELV